MKEKPTGFIINHREIADDLVKVCQQHKLPPEAAIKVLIYTATKLLAAHLKVSDKEATRFLELAAQSFRKEIERAERMFKNRG